MVWGKAPVLVKNGVSHPPNHQTTDPKRNELLAETEAVSIVFNVVVVSSRLCSPYARLAFEREENHAHFHSRFSGF